MEKQKRQILFILGLVFLNFALNSAIIQAQTPVQQIAAANDLYQEGKISEALAIYQQIEQQGLRSAQLYHNLGNAFYQSDSLASAILAYERGLKIKPNDKELLHNLNFAKQSIAFKVDTYPDIFYKRFIKNGIKSLAAWKWLFLAAIFAWLVFGAFYRFLNVRNRLFFFSGILAFIFALFALIAFFLQNNWETQNNQAILFGEVVPVKETAAEGSQTQFKLSAGNKLTVGESLDGWTKILFEDGNEGWVESKYLVLI